MGAALSGLRSRLGDAVAASLSALLTSRTKPENLFPHAARLILEHPDSLEVLCLDPEDHENGDPPGRFHGHRIIGRVIVESSSERSRLGHALIEGNRRTWPSFKCFDPYIGVIAKRSGESVSLAACFWCYNVEIVGPGEHRRIYPLSGWPARPLERYLNAAGIVVPPPPT